LDLMLSNMDILSFEVLLLSKIPSETKTESLAGIG